MKIKNIAVIPARRNSKGIKFKNRTFFNLTANFLKKLDFIDTVIVTSDDQIILKKAEKYKFQTHKRKKKYAGDAISIKKTLLNLIREQKLNKNDNLWLFYIPLVNREKKDFYKAYKITKTKKFKSLCSFIEIDYAQHPFYCWKYYNKKISQYIANKIFRRQDLPKAYSHFHYLCCFKVVEITKLNNELINSHTRPIFLNSDITKNLIEIDTPDDVKRYNKLKYKRKILIK